MPTCSFTARGQRQEFEINIRRFNYNIFSTPRLSIYFMPFKIHQVFYTITAKALPANQINFVSFMHSDKEHGQLRFGNYMKITHTLRIVVQHRANFAVFISGFTSGFIMGHFLTKMAINRNPLTKML